MTLEISKAQDLIQERVKPVATEIIPIENCLGRILATNIVAKHNLPPFNNSAMDGYAVRVNYSNKVLKVDKIIFAGDKAMSFLEPLEAVKIMTGAPIPKGCEAIVPIEDVNINKNKMVKFPEDIKEGMHVRFKGEDIAVDDILLHKGDKIYAYHFALLTSQGIHHVSVYKRPVVAVFSTGKELKMHFEDLQSHQIYNSNAPTFLARAKELGAEVNFIGSAKDNLQDIKKYIASSLYADLIVTSGGISVGDADLTKEAFSSFGIKRLFDKINIKPGKPTTLGYINKSWILNLPGNPLAALINFELFACKILHKLSGTNASFLGVIKAIAKVDINFKPGRVTVIPGRWDGQYFNPVNKRNSGMISPLITSNAMIIVGAKKVSINANEIVNMLSLHEVHSSCLTKTIINY